MTRSRLIGFLTLLLLASSLYAAPAQRISIAESKIRIDITDRATVKIPVTNTTNQPIPATLHLSFLDPNDQVHLDLLLPVVVGVGTTVLQEDVPGLLQLNAASTANYGWLRLKYGFSGEVEGIVSMSRVAPEPFVLDVISPREPAASAPYRVQVLARDPVLGKPVPNVEVRANLIRENKASVAIAKSIPTNTSGYAELNFDLPQLPSDSELTLEVSGTLGKFIRKMSTSLRVDQDFFSITSMDKPIYQPGEKLRVRALLFDRWRNAVRGSTVHVSIWDPDDDKVFETSVVTSAFGEAHTEWMIPDNSPVGNYEIRVGKDDRDRSIERVWIGTYNLPNFTVDVRHKRPYYVPGERAEVEIHADYLFGKPVPNGSVKVVRELRREWNYREQKWELEEGESIEGTTDNEGLFRARLDIDEPLQDLSQYRVFKDVPYAVFVTDPSTGRTEQRRFWTRITLYPIHLYVLQPSQARSLPLEFFVAASYADGSPAACNIEILEVFEDGQLKRDIVTTNKYGIAKIRGFTPSARLNDGTPQLEFRASDAAGNRGQRLERFYVGNESLRVSTDKSLYGASEPISVHIDSTLSRGLIVVNASTNGRVHYSTVLQLTDGKGDAVIPSSKAFSGSVLVSAYHSSIDSSLFDGRRVSFPATGGLEIESSFDKKTYAPGEEATLHLQLRNGNRSPQEGVFGVTVFDKAVEERAKADAEFGGRYSVCHLCASSLDFEPALPGLTVTDLHLVDRKQPVPPDLELAAEALLANWYGYEEQPRTIGDFESAATVYRSDVVQKRFDALRSSDNYPSGFNLPTDESALRAMVLKLDPEFANLHDPWDNSYRLTSSVSSYLNQIEILSSGVDEIFKSPDDFRVAVIQWPYFGEYGKTVRTAIDQYHDRTGGYIRDIQTLKDEILRLGQNFDEWHDPGGRPYTVEFGIERTQFTINIKSQDWIVWREMTDYTADLRPAIDAALNGFVLTQNSVPQADSDVRNLLHAAGISDNELLDPWKNLYYATFKIESGYFDSVTITSGLTDGVKIVPVTRQSEVLRLRSKGPDGIEGTPDDFTAFSLIRPVGEQSVEEAKPRFIESPLLDSSYGAICGIVIDTSGAVLPGVSAVLTSPTGREITLTTSDDNFIFRNLDPGIYQIRFSLPGFQSKLVTGVFVRAGVITRVVATLQVASVATMVEVTADVQDFLTLSAASVGSALVAADSVPQRPISTPKLREYFPETLLWQPSLETGTDGRAQVRFKLADSITTWKAVAIGSTKDGRIAVTEKEIVAFQPFFVEHDPPKFLTDGDRIDLPVVVRSYLDRDQSIDLSMKNADWFTSLGNPSRKVSVNAGDFAREVFSFRASKPVKDGRQQITALGAVSDAIEKTSTVYPFGREMTQVSNGIFRGASTHEVIVPQNALPGSVHAELKVYPNLISHVVDAIEGIMQRPYGCAEQVISSAYPSLLFLNHAKQTGRLSGPVSQKATRYLEIALRNLRGYKSDEGGFSYWTRGDPDVAVTAYAVQFLTAAEEFVDVDNEITSEAVDWLVMKQGKDGSWNSDPKLTAYIASVLPASPVDLKDEKNPVSLALAFLRKLSFQPSEPYTTASIALTALKTGDRQLAETALETLRSEVHYERDGAFWELQTNTPFYSWGRPGRLETTAVVVGAFAAGGKDSELVDKGLLFLLRNKDRYGVWYSSQATVRVLDALVRLTGSRQVQAPGSARILVNGVSVMTVAFGTRQQPDNPVIVDVSRFLMPGSNRVEVVEQKKTSTATVQLVESHYVPWDSSASDLKAGPLRYSVRYSKNEAAISDTITVHVEAERIGFRGYGMMLAEIGLPPGAEVDRESISAAIASAGWELSRFDVLPDRVLAYVWPRAGGTVFEFKFRQRYGVEAHTPASKLYDYYNPDAYSILLPENFRAK